MIQVPGALLARFETCLAARRQIGVDRSGARQIGVDRSGSGLTNGHSGTGK
jgi:hypothetical protein